MCIILLRNSSDLCFNSWCAVVGNHSQISRAIVAIRVLDINDNAPEFPTEYEAFLCENGKPGQVRYRPYYTIYFGSMFLIHLVYSQSFNLTGLKVKSKSKLEL